MWVAFAFAKATHIFSAKNTCELDIVLSWTVNILTTNELVKLTMLWTTGPWCARNIDTLTTNIFPIHKQCSIAMMCMELCTCAISIINKTMVSNDSCELWTSLCHKIQNAITWIKKNIAKQLKEIRSTMWICLFWGFMAQQSCGVMSSAVSLPNHTFTGQASSSKRLISIVQILNPETDNCPSWIWGRERMTTEFHDQSP